MEPDDEPRLVGYRTFGARVDERDAALDKAELCIAAGLDPSEYDGLSDIEREAFVDVINRSRRNTT